MAGTKQRLVEQSFYGTGWSFPPQFNKTDGCVEMSTAEKDITESLYILLSTVPGERLLQPEYGCRLKSMVFEQIDETAMTTIRSIIADAVLFFEPRITLDHVSFDQSFEVDGVLKINIAYTVRTTNSRSNMVYPFYLKEGNNLP